MNLIGVIGVGSPFGDDNIAQRVVTLLKQHQLSNKISIEYFDRPGLYLLEYMKDFKTVHLIDAIVSGKPIGTIHCFKNINTLTENNQLLSSHGLGVAEVLSLGRVLNCLPAKVIIHGIEIDSNHQFNVLSNEIKKASYRLVEQITKALAIDAK